MTSVRQVVAMIRSHAAGDQNKFLSIAEHIADGARRSGQSKAAEDIAAAVADVRRAQGQQPAPVPIAMARGELGALMRASYPEIRLSDVVLGSDLEQRIERVIREHRQRGLLEANGLQPRRKYLLSGPPGTGKGMTASAVAGELGLPLFTILLDGVITKFMGETASKLRLIFDAMRTTRGVYFFDEVDALASSRDADNDIGEARRMLNSFLQFLEDDGSDSVLVAATNHRSLLDRAIFRRFHAVFEYDRPAPQEARRVLKKHLLAFKSADVRWKEIDAAMAGLSQADLMTAAQDASRSAVLDHGGRLTTAVLVQALRDRRTSQPY